ncbi:hypothetical protein ACYTTR_18855, partial [Cobetia marina]
RLQGAVIEPAIHDNEDLNRVPMDKREEIKLWVDSMHGALKSAVENRNPDYASSHLKLLKSYMDHRIPQDVKLIRWAPGVEDIISTPAQARPQPQNHEVTSG